MDSWRELAAQWLPDAHVGLAADASQSVHRRFKALLSSRSLPSEGWSDDDIRFLLYTLSRMDTNNFFHSTGVGEREGKVYSRIVQERHFGMAHGVGRAGDVSAAQPKAAGSSILATLANTFVASAIREAGLTTLRETVVVPVATGMAMTLVLLSLRQQMGPRRTRVLWPRMDQKSCLKAITAAGLEPVVVENVLEDDQVRTNVSAIEKLLQADADGTILCVMTTASCFAPRAPDRLEAVARLCKTYDVAHVVNNAYGIQCGKILLRDIDRSARVGRVDATVQSLDKNFLVPVGGAVIATLTCSSAPGSVCQNVRRAYPGRASAAPACDLFITLLSMGKNGFRKLLDERESLMEYMREHVEHVATRVGERLLRTPNNPVSMAITLRTVREPTRIGSMLFRRNVTGTRVVEATAVKEVAGIRFEGYGSHHESYPCVYLSFACAIGTTRADIEVFARKLEAVLQSAQVERVGNTADVLTLSADAEARRGDPL